MDESELRKIDALVAERVMGWNLSPQTTAIANVGEYWIASGSGEVMVMRDYGCAEWNPTTNPADAMAVLKRCAEKLWERDANIELGRCPRDEDRPDDKSLWFVTHTHTIVSADAETLELAICLLALKLFP